MSTSYEIRSAGRPVLRTDASTPQEAVVDYVRSLGCQDDEIRRLAADTVTWRGAIFTAVPATAGDERVARRVA